MEFIWGVLAIAAASGTYLAYRKGISQGFQFAKNQFDRLIKPKTKIAFLNGRDETLEAFRDEIHMFRIELKRKRSGKVIDKMTDEQMANLEHIRELAAREAAETRRNMEEQMRAMARPVKDPYTDILQGLWNQILGKK